MFGQITQQVSDLTVISVLPLLIVAVPIIGAFIIGAIGMRSSRIRDLSAVIITALTLYLSIELFLLALKGYTITYWLPALGGARMAFGVDLTGAFFALFTAAIWFLATLASLPYMEHEGRQTRYYIFLILSLGGCIGVFVSGDFLSLFLFFELMTLAAYALVVHAQTGEAMRAGANYLYLGVIGGLSLLVGMIILYVHTGSLQIGPRAADLAGMNEVAFLVAALMIAGFGVKAGMIPLHIWLPQAHPVAPSPASALLSGIMIKTGAYGIIRISTMLYTPAVGPADNPLWQYSQALGHIIIWISIITMLLAAIMAVLQDDAKRLLAYSSISQMGYILMGVGSAAYLGYDGPMGFGGFSYHIVNHAFFKSGLFMLFGMVYARLHERSLSKLGGLWKSFPFTFTAFTVCSAGIMGVPGFNGYVSKTLLHHAIVEAYEHHYLWDLWLAEKLFMLTSGLTVCYIAKLFISLFLGDASPGLKAKLESGKVDKEKGIEKFVALSYIAVILFLGLFSRQMISGLIVPMTGSFTYAEYYVNYLNKTSVWILPDLISVAIGLSLGAVFYLTFKRKNVFDLKPPDYLSVEESVYRPATRMLGKIFTGTGRLIDDTANRGVHGAPAILVVSSVGADYLDNQVFNNTGRNLVQLSIRAWETVYSLWIGAVNRLFFRVGHYFRSLFMTLFKFDYSSKGDRRFQTINISNIDFDLYILLIVIGVILATSLLFIL